MTRHELGLCALRDILLFEVLLGMGLATRFFILAFIPDQLFVFKRGVMKLKHIEIVVLLPRFMFVVGFRAALYPVLTYRDAVSDGYCVL